MVTYAPNKASTFQFIYFFQSENAKGYFSQRHLKLMQMFHNYLS